MKGIILAGGNGKRLRPLTFAMSKQLLPVYDKPLVYYPLSTLMLAGIREIMLISSPDHIHLFERLLGNGENLGINLTYKTQLKPNGLAEAFLLAEDFIGNDEVALILGDNIFFGQGLGLQLSKFKNIQGAHIFAYEISNPTEYGVVEFNENNDVISIEEKPLNPKSNYAVPGLYFYDNRVVAFAKSITPSKRGELEITDVNLKYLENRCLKVDILPRGTAWMDTGTIEGLHLAGTFVKSIEDRQGLKIACPEEIAYRKGWISQKELAISVERNENTSYGAYLINLKNQFLANEIS